MKILNSTLSTVLLLAAFAAGTAQGQSAAPAALSAPTHIATVDMQKLFNNYWKKQRAQVALENHKTELRKEINDLADSLKKAQTEYKTLVESANDQTLSATEREKNRDASQLKAREMADYKDSLEKLQRQAETQLADQAQRMSADVVTDLQKAIADQAKAKGYDLVLSTKTETVIFAAPQLDITADVLKQLNAGAPIDVAQPATTPGPTNTVPVITTP